MIRIVICEVRQVTLRLSIQATALVVSCLFIGSFWSSPLGGGGPDAVSCSNLHTVEMKTSMSSVEVLYLELAPNR